MDLKKTKNTLPEYFVFGSVFLFLILKFCTLSIRFGDGWTYWYMTHTFLGGALPYRDFFLADPPFLILFFIPFQFLFGTSSLVFHLLPIFLEVASALLIFFILRHEKNQFYFLAPFLYLFSFTVLATSDFFPGMQVAIFLSLLAILFSQKGKPVLSGFFWSFAVLTKLYIAPALIGWMVCLLFQRRWKQLWRTMFGGIIATGIVLLPFIFLAWPQIFNDVISFHLQRFEGLSKVNILTYFLQREWFFLGVGMIGMVVLRKRFFVLPFIFSATFFLFFQDIYYLYLDTLMPYLIFATLSFTEWVWEKFHKKGLLYVLIGVYVFSALIGVVHYQKQVFSQNRFLNSDEVVRAVKALPDSFPLYGSYEYVPLVALASGRPIFHVYIDTNVQVFRAGIQNINKISNEAVSEGVYLLTRATVLSEDGKKDEGYEEYFDASLFKKYCTRVAAFSARTPDEGDVGLAMYRCKK